MKSSTLSLWSRTKICQNYYPRLRIEEIRRYTPGFALAVRAALLLDHLACRKKTEMHILILNSSIT